MAQNPTLLLMPLARDGDKATIPETAGSTTGDFSQKYGFQQINQLPLGAGGIAPKRNDFNGAFNLLGGIAFYAQKGWQFEYDAGQDYYAGCVVRDATNGKSYLCIADVSAGAGIPSADTAGAHWQELPEVASFFRQPSTTYIYNDVRLAYGLKQPFYLQCTTGGTSKNDAITIPASPTAGSTISDGTVTWTIRKVASTSDIPSTSGYITKEETPAFNKRDVITTSGTYTAPVTGWYKIKVTGGGQGGQGGGKSSDLREYGGAGGQQGTTTIIFEYLTAGESVAVVIGAGGTGGAKSTTGGGANGSAGGLSSVTIRGHACTSDGVGLSNMSAGYIIEGLYGGRGLRLQLANTSQQVAALGGIGGGAPLPGAGGTGGTGAAYSGATSSDGSDGNAGIVAFEYWAE